ncbi:MAG: glycerol-3-phosphate 1-O-acyltransferase PlsY [Clostridia bacterium]|nr:glycerol-3-phosphate 1-O-acyltransferase PlsY [Clostridia bacterium]
MTYVIGAIIGYLLGSLNPAALISKIKHKNLRKSGTGNLGATNVMLNFGKGFGLLVMLFDILKGFAAVKLAELIFPESAFIGMVSGLTAIIGHIFPFYISFKGGKGLAAFAGVVLAYNPWLFLFLLLSGCVLMIIVNYSFILPFYAAAVFSVFAAVTSKSIPLTLLCAAASALIMIKHAGNIQKAKEGTDNKVRDVIKRMILKNKAKAGKNDGAE